ncbi:MAG: helicase-associated domain-containing protein, partial [Actinomycetota bacterium]|nr:helicase-associated domain-containing protein [Actinomycetota bacterium]
MARISDDLRAMSDESLAALFANRPDLHADPPADVNSLAQRLSTPTGARVGIEQLDRPALQVCHHVVLVSGHPLGDGAVRVSDLAEWTALAPGEPSGEDLLGALGTAVVRLREVGLVHGDPARPVSGLRQVLAPPVAAGRTARRLLELAPDSAVRLLAEQHGLDPRDAHSARERLADLLPRLGPAQLLEGVSDRAVALFVEAVEHQEYAVPLPGGTIEQWAHVRAGAEPVLELVLRGVLVPLTPAVGEIPRELRHAVLRELDPYLVRLRPPPAQARPQAAVLQTAAADAAERAGRVVGLVERLLETWSREPAVQLVSGGLGVKELRRAGKLLDVDERDAGRVVELALVAGLLRGERRGPAVLPSPAYDEWLALDVPHRWAALAGAWWRSERLPSAAGSRDGGQPLPALHWQSPSEALEVRHRVLALLAEQPGLAEDELLDRMHARAPARWAVGAAELVARGAYAEAVLLGIAAGPPTPGVLAPWAPDGSETWPGEGAVRELAAALPERVRAVTLQADLTAVAAGPVAPEAGRVLDLLADVESRGAATVWRFGPASVRRAFDDGWTASMVLHELEQIAARGVPGTLTTLVGDVARRHGQVRVGAASAYLR